MPRIRKSLSRSQRRARYQSAPAAVSTRSPDIPPLQMAAERQEQVNVFVYRSDNKIDWTGWQRWSDFVAGLEVDYPHARKACPGAGEDAKELLLAARLAARDLGWNGEIVCEFFVAGTFPSQGYLIGWESDVSIDDFTKYSTFFASNMPIPPHPRAVYLGHKAIHRTYSLSDLIIERSRLVPVRHPEMVS